MRTEPCAAWCLSTRDPGGGAGRGAEVCPHRVPHAQHGRAQPPLAGRAGRWCPHGRPTRDPGGASRHRPGEQDAGALTAAPRATRAEPAAADRGSKPRHRQRYPAARCAAPLVMPDGVVRWRGWGMARWPAGVRVGGAEVAGTTSRGRAAVRRRRREILTRDGMCH